MQFVPLKSFFAPSRGCFCTACNTTTCCQYKHGAVTGHGDQQSCTAPRSAM